ncbi:hypothetical protein [Streptomyces cahuitamycinicus]|uniref:Uncharacterized protein n=1 Tax=Streptomyces cahuitamycinicus TaxID=2070367 RepID=A0A2N8TL66_9ACTN|nr:hypothetical protein [Streptomyces cahuitamycinicus]PNG19733.1 hypothetical protein C1J00_24015 [Streptomyces cahuitamycinicus]
MSAPLVVNTRDGVCWTRRTVTSGGIALYAPESVRTCPDFVMATLAEHGIAGSADALPVPVGSEPRDLAGTFGPDEKPEERQARWENAAWAAGRTVDRNALAVYMVVADAEQQKLADDWAKSVAAGDEEQRRLRARVAELEAAPTTVYRAEHPDSGITLGHYGTDTAARAHCEATERRSWPTGTSLSFDWIEDEDDGVAELVVTAGQNEESTTGYIVTAIEVPSEYDEEADA